MELKSELLDITAFQETISVWQKNGEIGSVECQGAATFVCLCAHVCKCNSLVDLFDTLNSVHT